MGYDFPLCAFIGKVITRGEYGLMAVIVKRGVGNFFFKTFDNSGIARKMADLHLLLFWGEIRGRFGYGQLFRFFYFILFVYYHKASRSTPALR